MAESTEARDRAIEAAADALVEQGWIRTSGEGDGALDIAQVIVDALRRRPEVLRALAGVPARDVDGTEWGAKWSDGGYCPSNPPRSEAFARQHARQFGTRPIRREVGAWVYADTGEPAFPATNPPEEDAR